ncbi:MAG TPA: universal stress protein [Deltaproteobacteria bacterium]|nr:universal stress protein [Deltaproteobacteria bacterium]
MNIVVAYRKSPLKTKLLEKAIEQARTFGGTIYLVTSLPGGPRQSVEELDESQNALDEAVQIVEKENIPCEDHLLVQGQSSGEDIVQFAQDHSAELIIIGVEKKSKVGKFIMGSTAQHVVLQADCPVITVK